ncbi:MAG TPA: GlsB/YeaQ/YmgE family stress response membrane protein [Paracoccus sp. (in: a-proteobacteria)]|nr:GlsB/YeaQ/YmgE family stress response membrane protein [Paracoccus sp. (in: a-proteobacteria)]
MGLIVSLIIGAIAGWLAGQIVKGHGQGVVMNIVVGIIGALLASWLFPALGWRMGSAAEGGASVLGSIVFSTIGAVILLLIVRLFTRR